MLNQRSYNIKIGKGIIVIELKRKKYTLLCQFEFELKKGKVKREISPLTRGSNPIGGATTLRGAKNHFNSRTHNTTKEEVWGTYFYSELSNNIPQKILPNPTKVIAITLIKPN